MHFRCYSALASFPGSPMCGQNAMNGSLNTNAMKGGLNTNAMKGGLNNNAMKGGLSTINTDLLGGC